MNLYLKYVSIILCLVFVGSLTLIEAKDFTITGTVKDAKTNSPLPGVSVRLQSTNRGTYTGINGQFRLRSISDKPSLLIVKSIGYQTQEIPVTELSTHFQIALIPSEIKTDEVVITALDVNGIIRKAIEQKNENKRRIQTLKATLYSKLTSEIVGNGALSSSSSNSVSFTGNSASSLDSTSLVLESISEIHIDYIKQKQQNTIIQRRQTRNIDSESNTLALSRFINFYNDEISILNATFLSPLATEPFERYTYTLEDRQTIGDKFVYSIKVTPKSTLFPSFKGTIKIIDGTFQLIEVDLQPADATPIPLISNVRFLEKFEEIAQDTWHPTYLKSEGIINAEIIKGIVEIGVTLQATTIFTDIVSNIAIPDSIWDKKSIVVAKNADSLQTEIWSSSTVEELSEKEKSFYKKNEEKNNDSLTLLRSRQNEKMFDFPPIYDFNRISGISTGTSIITRIVPHTLIDISPSYSFALKDILINAQATYYFDSTKKYAAFAKAYSQMQTVGHDKSISPIVNSIGALIFGNDYYDWYKQDGWGLGFTGELFKVKGTLELTESRHFSDTLKVKRSLFEGTQWRKNPAIDNGAFRTLRLAIHYGEVSPLQQQAQISMDIEGLWGTEYITSQNFQRLGLYVETMLPLYSTGYNAITLRTSIDAGIATGSVPFQYRLRLRNILTPFAPFGGMYSAPVGLYNGTELLHIQSEINCTDLWWRALGLPLYEARGIDLYIGGGMALLAKNTSDRRSTTTQTQHYSEIGLGFGRIPTFFSNIIFLRFDIRTGLGPFASGRVGWGLGMTLPF